MVQGTQQVKVLAGGCHVGNPNLWVPNEKTIKKGADMCKAASVEAGECQVSGDDPNAGQSERGSTATVGKGQY